MRIPEGDFAAYLFDCDGTLADSMPLHYEAWCEALSKWGCPFPEKQFYDWAGIPGPTIVRMLNEQSGLSMPAQAIVDLKEHRYLDLLPKVKPKSAVLEQVELGYRKIPMAVVSGSPRESIVKTLAALGISDRFGAIVGAEDCARGKPDPEPYLLAASRLGVAPTRCLVFEDADLGIASARAAGMAWIKVE